MGLVIADPEKPAVLLLEVKGGQIEVTDGHWYQNGHPMSSTPLNQPLGFMKEWESGVTSCIVS